MKRKRKEINDEMFIVFFWSLVIVAGYGFACIEKNLHEKEDRSVEITVTHVWHHEGIFLAPSDSWTYTASFVGGECGGMGYKELTVGTKAKATLFRGSCSQEQWKP